jgi:hypothetical protein
VKICDIFKVETKRLSSFFESNLPLLYLIIPEAFEQKIDKLSSVQGEKAKFHVAYLLGWFYVRT